MRRLPPPAPPGARCRLTQQGPAWPHTPPAAGKQEQANVGQVCGAAPQACQDRAGTGLCPCPATPACSSQPQGSRTCGTTSGGEGSVAQRGTAQHMARQRGPSPCVRAAAGSQQAQAGSTARAAAGSSQGGDGRGPTWRLQVGRGATGSRSGCTWLQDISAVPSCAAMCQAELCCSGQSGMGSSRLRCHHGAGSGLRCLEQAAARGGQPTLIKAAIAQ